MVNVVRKEDMTGMPDALYRFEGIIGVVNSDVITPSEVREMTEPAVREARQNLKGQDLLDRLQEIAAAAINQLVTRTLILQKARSEGLKVAESDIDERLQQTIDAQSAGDRISFVRSLAVRGYTLEKFRERLRDDIIVETMRKQAVAEANNPVEKEQVEREWLNGLQKEAYIKIY
jgi:peptidyl-prolyl cis-trans isomerase SurA